MKCTAASRGGIYGESVSLIAASSEELHPESASIFLGLLGEIGKYPGRFSPADMSIFVITVNHIT